MKHKHGNWESENAAVDPVTFSDIDKEITLTVIPGASIIVDGASGTVSMGYKQALDLRSALNDVIDDIERRLAPGWPP